MIPTPDNGFVDRIPDSMPADLKVVNAARVSMGKRVDKFVYAGTPEAEERKRTTGMGPDDSLLRYLATHNHWTPFAQVRLSVRIEDLANFALAQLLASGVDGARFSGFDDDDTTEFDYHDSIFGLARRCDWLTARTKHLIHAVAPECAKALGVDPPDKASVFDDKLSRTTHPHARTHTFHIKMPIYLARQWMKSGAGVVYNEVSRRYVDAPPEFALAPDWCYRPEKNIKQGAGERMPDDSHDRRFCDNAYDHIATDYWYRQALERNAAPEQARTVLPLCTMTEFWMTGGEADLMRLVNLRVADSAQQEIRPYAEAVRKLIEEANDQ